MRSIKQPQLELMMCVAPAPNPRRREPIILPAHLNSDQFVGKHDLRDLETEVQFTKWCRVRWEKTKLLFVELELGSHFLIVAVGALSSLR